MRDTLLSELQFSIAIVLSREEVVPRFRVHGDDGEWTVFVPLSDDARERDRRMRLVAGFMAWKSATAFVLSAELISPDLVYACAVGRGGVMMAGRQIARTPLTVGPITWFDAESVGDEITALLPRGKVALDAETMRALERAFGKSGEFEARLN